jgi:hypothetical protein
MTEQGITRDEFLAHIGYVRADVAEVKAAVGASASARRRPNSRSRS